MVTKQSLLRQLPAIGLILEQEEIKTSTRSVPHALVAEAAAEVVQKIRELIIHQDEPADAQFDLNYITGMVLQNIAEKSQPSLRRVINATGIVLHTNLGRAVLAKEAVRAINEVAGSYSNLELDLTTGERGTRYEHVEQLLCRLTGAEAGLVVNNNAGAVLLVLNALARSKEVIVSRGQLVEIGGSFRIPDVMAQSGAVLAEVGTTNKTHLRDYRQAITGDTALLLKVHTSNYKIIGFTSEVSTPELVSLGKETGIPVYEDLGSGMLIDFTKYGMVHEPTVTDSIKAGVDVVTCSGDKLFGGPQSGIILGSAQFISRIKRNPLTRALRVDKFTLAAMEATLRLYLDEENAVRQIPTLNMITMSLDELRWRAEELLSLVADRLGDAASAEIIDGLSQVGGGALPEENIPTVLVSVKPQGMSVNALEASLRQMGPPVLTRIQKDRVLFDPRTLLDGDSETIAAHLEKILEKGVSQLDGKETVLHSDISVL